MRQVLEVDPKTVGALYKKKFISYINSLSLSEVYKESITDCKFIDENPIFYIYYPKLFSSAFQELESTQIDQLCIAGYLYYQSTLFLDSVIDEGNKKGLFNALVCQEEATKIMTHLFGLDSSYWGLWDKRRNEYLRAIHIEKEFLKTSNKISIEQYAGLADFKASFGKAAIDSIFKLSAGTDEYAYTKMINSHKYFSLAFQINDDVLDFKEDFEKGQFNWAVYSIYNSSSKVSVIELNKLFYIRGAAKSLFEKAIEYLDMAINEVRDISVPIWVLELEKLKNKFCFSIIEIDNYLELLNSEIKLSKKFVINNSINLSVESAIKFMRNSQNDDGSWREYINQGGISDTWSTAFIVSKLSGKNLNVQLEDNIKNAMNFLQNSKKEELWGYNQNWINDADTTNFVLLAFHYNLINIDDSILEKWISFYRKGQGFSTYIDSDNLLNSLGDKNITNVNSWTSGHQCVSAVSFYYLTVSKNFTSVHSNLDELFNEYLLRDDIKAYWWTSKIYTFYYLIKSYDLLENSKNVNLILSETAKIQNDDGSFSDKYGPNFFLTGKAIKILLVRPKEYNYQIEKGINFLLTHQYLDGSWQNSNCLQIPDPELIDETEIYPVNTHGTSVRAKEFNRLFTTVSILETLSHYGERIVST